MPTASFCGIMMVTPSRPEEEAACGSKSPKPTVSISHFQVPIYSLLHKGKGR
jgi:hypothetical protein